MSGSVNSENSEEFRQDGLYNAISGLGTGNKDRSVYTTVSPTQTLTEGQLEDFYQLGVPRRYVDAIADEVLRHLTTLKLGEVDQDSQKLIQDFETYLQVLKFHHAFSEVVKLQRLYGGAAIVMFIDDGQDPAEPVNFDRIRKVTDLVALSRYQIIPEDFTLLDYSKPTHYLINTSQKLQADQTENTTNLRVHSSRVARFDGLYLPWNLRVNNQGWGQSVLQPLWEAFRRFETALSGLEELVADADIFVHKMPGLFTRLMAGGEAEITKRLEANKLARSLYGGYALDKEEEVDFLTRNLSNLASATEPFVSNMQAVTGWPASVLMGDSPGGLGKEGRFEERVWATLVEQWQEVYCRASVTEVFTVLLLAQEGPTRGRLPESWSVDFPSVFTQTEEEEADLKKKLADVDSIYINMGVLSPLEVRASRFGGTEYSQDTNLDEITTERMKIKEQAQYEAELVGIERSLMPPEPQPGQPEEPGEAPQPPEDEAPIEDGQNEP